MTLRLLIHWEDEDEIDSAISLMNELRECMRDKGLYSGASLVNIPFMKTVGIRLKDFRASEVNPE